MNRIDIKKALKDPEKRKAIIDGVVDFMCSMENHSHIDQRRLRRLETELYIERQRYRELARHHNENCTCMEIY